MFTPSVSMDPYDEGRKRDGVRGGLEQFRWDSLKTIAFKDREQYLGASTKLGTLRKFGQYATNDWWSGAEGARATQTKEEALRSERERAKEMEAELFQEALGLKPKRLLLTKGKLSHDQVSEILKKEEAGPSGGDASVTLVNSVKGANLTDEVAELEQAQSRTGLGWRQYAHPQDYVEHNGVLFIKPDDEEDELETKKRAILQGVKTEEESVPIRSSVPPPQRPTPAPISAAPPPAPVALPVKRERSSSRHRQKKTHREDERRRHRHSHRRDDEEDRHSSRRQGSDSKESPRRRRSRSPHRSRR